MSMLAPALAFGPLPAGTVSRQPLRLRNEAAGAAAHWTLTLAKVVAAAGGEPGQGPANLAVKPAAGSLLPRACTTVQARS